MHSWRGLWGRKDKYGKLAGLQLGELEKSVMELVWTRGECTVRDLHAEFAKSHAYTTIMTTLDRLHKKGLLDRHKQGKAFCYSARLTRPELEEAMARDLVNMLLTEGSAQSLLSCFVDAIGEHDAELLRELEEEVHRRRAGLEEEGK